MTPPHISIVSRSLPPMVIGTPIILYNLFSEYKGKISGIGGHLWEAKIDKSISLPFYMQAYFKSNNKYIQRLIEKFQFYLFPLIRLFVEKQLRKQSPDIVFAVFPNPIYFVAAFLGAKKLNLPFVAHIHDLWEENASSKKELIFAKYWENKILNQADKVYCTTSSQVNWYKKKYGIQALDLPHTIRDQDIKEVSDKIKQKNDNVIITYTGNVNKVLNLDTVQLLIKAIDYLPENYIFKFLVSFDRPTLERFDLYHERCQYSWTSKEESKNILKSSDLLFLPLSFKESNKPEVKSVYATKTLDYLISGIPIFVCSPIYAHHNELAKKEGWGHVFESNAPKLLAKEIQKVIQNNSYCIELVKNAQIAAKNRRSSLYINKLIKEFNKIIEDKYLKLNAQQ